ncbi:MAG: ComF family protein [Hyphomicrobiaceae bacterium]|nr:ComF family protein [Hyphomicrobiaceae bacterium]
MFKRAPAALASTPGSGGLIARALDLLMPPVCLSCHLPMGTPDSLCPACWSQVDFIGHPVCDRLGLPMPYATGEVMISAAAAAQPPIYARARAVAAYDGTMARLIKGFKFSDRLEARRLLGTLLMQAGRELLEDARVIVPVPLARGRLFHRRFNQSAILAKEVARRSQKPFAPLALTRVRPTRRQVGLSARQREANVAKAFAVPVPRRAIVSGQRVLLVDDVITTGATANAAARALLEAGATAVDVLALALVTAPARMTT